MNSEEAAETTIVRLRQVATDNPNHADCWLNLGCALGGENQLAEAADAFRRALTLQPTNTAALVNLGIVFRRLGQVNEALECYNRALTIAPHSAETFFNRGNLWTDLRKIDAALLDYRLALTIRDDFLPAAEAAAHRLIDLKRAAEAEILLEPLLTRHPLWAAGWRALALIHEQSLRHSAAAAAYEESYRLNPRDKSAQVAAFNYRQLACDWRNWNVNLQAILSTDIHLAKPSGVCSLPSTLEQQFASAVHWARSSFGELAEHGKGVFLHTPRSRKVLRIGYISAHFRRHALGSAVAELLQHHDRNSFAITVYSYGDDDGSDVRERIRSFTERFIDVGQRSDREIAQLIYEDGIDILVDITSLDKGGRLGISALRPAPVQVTYLGCSGTTGAKFYDYTIFDERSAPREIQPFYVEDFAHLPMQSHFWDRSVQIDSRIRSRTELGLPESTTVLCSFNNPLKLTPDVFTIWMRVLHDFPETTLWILETNGEMAGNLRARAAAAGVAPERIVFAFPEPSALHLSRYRACDLFLDSFPYSAGMTALDALWMGCPLVTCVGQVVSSRAAASMLHDIGLGELVATDLEGYERVIRELVSDGERLRSLRTYLEREGRSTRLFDMPAKTRAVEGLYREMWKRFEGGLAAAPIVLTPS